MFFFKTSFRPDGNMPHEFINKEKAEFKIKFMDEGTGGNKCSKFSTARVHYIGKVLGGKEFFNSYKLHAEGERAEPLQLMIGVGAIITGLDKGIMQMTKGQKA